jgi:NADH-quinone oxidoreductase subunit B
LEGFILLQEAIDTEHRPLSWTVGDQGVERPQLTGRLANRRDLKRDERARVTDLRSPDHV